MSETRIDELETLAVGGNRSAIHAMAAQLRQAERELNRDAIEERDEIKAAVRDYVRERRDADVLGPARCRVDRYYTKLEQLA